MKHKRPVRGNCWVITIIYSLHFNFEHYFFNNKGAGIISEPGEGRALGPEGSGGSACARPRVGASGIPGRTGEPRGAGRAPVPASGLQGRGHSTETGEARCLTVGRRVGELQARRSGAWQEADAGAAHPRTGERRPACPVSPPVGTWAGRLRAVPAAWLGLARHQEPGARPALPPTACAAPERLLTFFVSRFSHARPHAAKRSEISGGKHRCDALIWLAAERWLPATPTTLSGCHGLRGAGLSPGLGYSFGCARRVPIPCSPSGGVGCEGCWRIAPRHRQA